jgi:hypothetical protein
LNPRTSSIASPVVIDGDSSRDDGSVDGSLVLLVWHYCSSGDSDGWLCWWTDISLCYLIDVKKTYAVLLAVQVASIQFPSPGSYQSIRQLSRTREMEQRTGSSPHGWTIGLDGLTDVTKWTMDQYRVAYECIGWTYVVVVGLAFPPPPRGVVVVVLAVVLLDEDEDEEELEEVRGSKGSSNAELDEEETELVRAVPVGWPLVSIALHVRR